MKFKAFKSKATRRSVFAVVSAAAVLLLLALNLLLTHFGIKKAIFIDMTPEGLYTLSDAFKDECSFIEDLKGADGKEQEVKITFCADPDTLISSELTRVVYFMAIEMEKEFDNVKVETYNVNYNKTAVSKYRPTSLTRINPSDVIVSFGDRYIVVNATSFWVISSETLWAYNGEYKMASLIKSVTAKNRPTAYFTTGHGETYYDTSDRESKNSVNTAALYDLLTERGLNVKTVDLTKETAIPDDCVLLIINNPTEDFTPDESRLNEFDYVSPLEAIDRYLVKDHGSVMVAKDYKLTLTNLENFLCEWGFDFSSSLLKDKSSVLDAGGATLVGDYDTNPDSYGYMLYSEFASLSSAPKMVFSDTGYLSCVFGTGTEIPEDGSYSITRRYEPLFYSSKKASSYKKDPATGLYESIEEREKVFHLAGVSTRVELDAYTAEYKYSDLFCAASGEFFSNELLGNSSYANYQIVSVLTESLTRTEEYASTSLGGISANLDNAGGKILLDQTLTETAVYEFDPVTGENEIVNRGLNKNARTVITVLVMLVPAIVMIVGIVVCIRRRFL